MIVRSPGQQIGGDLAQQGRKLESVPGTGADEERAGQSGRSIYDEIIIGRNGIQAHFFISDFPAKSDKSLSGVPVQRFAVFLLDRSVHRFRRGPCSKIVQPDLNAREIA